MANTIGFIGLGTMGTPMVRNLLKHGHAVTVWARRREAMTPLLAGGVASGVRPGSLVIDHSTIDPAGARRIADELQRQGIEMLDAPVSGGGLAAEAGTLSIRAGGSKDAFDRAHPLLSCYAKSIVHIGPSGAGQVAKACNQICTIVNQLGAAEAMLLAERAGVDANAVKQAMMGGFAASRMLDLQAPKMIARDFNGKVESRLHHKDIHIVLELARKFGIELPASAAAARVLDVLQERGGARRDSAAIFTVLDSPR
jgi:3-hydroxyisobutyrate dehydrogenase-like beta-hydroxyacid dehydrogenase